MYFLLVSFFPVTITFSAFTTMTKSPASRCGVYTGLFLPRKIFATWAARRPRTAPSALMTCHLRWSKFTVGRCVFISNPEQKREETSKQKLQVNSVFTVDFCKQVD